MSETLAPHQEQMRRWLDVDFAEIEKRFLAIDPASVDADRTVLICGKNAEFFIIDELDTITPITLAAASLGEITHGLQEISGTFELADASFEALRELMEQLKVEKTDTKPVPDRGPYKADPFSRKLSVEEMQAEVPNRAQRRAQAAKIRRKY